MAYLWKKMIKISLATTHPPFPSQILRSNVVFSLDPGVWIPSLAWQWKPKLTTV